MRLSALATKADLGLGARAGVYCKVGCKTGGGGGEADIFSEGIANPSAGSMIIDSDEIVPAFVLTEAGMANGVRTLGSFRDSLGVVLPSEDML
jgi:hypothetical protein